ncbi:MAG: hypothetical protein FJ319_08015 [SAR202 cluster bacterium]|nr:hypothetical protein [SAR202 cluster bacterium]
MEKAKQDKPKLNKAKLKEVALWVLTAAFPLLYVASVRAESAVAAGVVLLVVAASAATAAIVF